MINKRLKIFNQIALDRKVKMSQPFKATIDGKLHTVAGPLNSLKLPKNALFAKVRYFDPELGLKLADPDLLVEDTVQQDWKLSMLTEPILGDCNVQMVTFEDPDAKMAFQHSSAHILGYAIEQVYEDALLTIGPSIKEGFFYDFQGPIIKGEEDYKKLEKAIKTIVNKNYQFERLLLTKEQALDMFSYNKFKTELISKKVADDELTSVFKMGDFIDLCTGPHIPSTKYVQGFKIMKHSQAYWLGDSKRDSLQRVYGISFPQKDQLAEFLRIKQEALKRDHRVIGPNQDLFLFNELAPGSPFFLPHGTKIYNKLMDFMRDEYRRRGYQEVISPNLCNIDLWKTSGHYKNYKDNLYLLKNQDGDKIESQGLKPMNCPGHCLIFKNQTHSYKELPIRFADFGVLHRNELSGALSGLTRVRRFQQDDAHIFCRKDQIEQEVRDCLGFLEKVYGIFNFEYDLFLSTRPEDSLGNDELWQEAEGQLERALNHSGKEWKINKGDGAFYGPKIDIVIQDVLGRPQQCGTIQLDFQLPIRFNLQYSSSEHTEREHQELQSEVFEPDEYSSSSFEWKERPLKPKCERPVMVHRAIFGSMERFMAILIEHLGGRWPLWLSPRQVKIVPVSSKNNDYVKKLEKRLFDNGWEVEVDLSEASLNKKVRNAQVKQFNFILVVGDEEMEGQTIDVRTREGERIGKLSPEEFENHMISLYPEDVALPKKSFK